MVDVAMGNVDAEPDREAKGRPENEDVEGARDTTLNIYQRVHAVMQQVKYVSRESEMQMGNTKIAYTSHDEATEAVRDAIVQHGIVIVSGMFDYTINGNRIEMTIRVDFVNVDAPEDRIQVTTIGFGVDSSDKGPGKAMSYAVKMVVLKTFQLIGGNEPEDDSTEHDPAVATASKKEEAEHDAVMKHSASLNNLKAALETAQSIEEIERLRRENSKMFKEIPTNTLKFFVDLMDRREDELTPAPESS